MLVTEVMRWMKSSNKLILNCNINELERGRFSVDGKLLRKVTRGKRGVLDELTP